MPNFLSVFVRSDETIHLDNFAIFTLPLATPLQIICNIEQWDEIIFEVMKHSQRHMYVNI